MPTNKTCAICDAAYEQIRRITHVFRRDPETRTRAGIGAAAPTVAETNKVAIKTAALAFDGRPKANPKVCAQFLA